MVFLTHTTLLLSSLKLMKKEMGRAPCCAKVGLHRGTWSEDEDKLLINYIQTHGEGQWRSMPSKAGLLRCGKSCRLRWINYLRPGLKRGNFTSEENDIIIHLHSVHGNRWSFIATELPGRTDNEIKNYWNAHLKQKALGDNRTENKRPKRKTKTEQKSKKTVETSSSLSSSVADNGCTLDEELWWRELLEMEDEVAIDSLMMKDDESKMLDKLYHECLHLLQDEDVII